MKTKSFFCLIFKILLIILTCMSFFNLAPAVGGNLKIEKISARAYAVLPVAGGAAFSNSAFMVLDDGVLVIDSQSSKELAQELISLVKQTTEKPIKYLVSTHFHADHTAGVETFGPEVRKIMHASTLEKLEGEKAILNYPVLTTHSDANLNYSGFSVQIFWMGNAHTHGDLIVYLPAEKVIIAGDIFFNQIIPFVKDAEIGQWISTIQRILELDFEKIVPGHGAVTDKSELRRFRELLAWAKAVAGNAIDKGTPQEQLLEAAHATELYKTRIVSYAHQEWLSDLLSKATQEIMVSRGRFNLQK